ncbi:EF-hand domain-containing protein [Inhella proteolytica]|uniref:EF-hand domain-containing protein n=1 Tax=Inhella proteolytica TaxID=2795029 RepID=A0A931J055_9BURK|nr:EF-hand domain-containing protein [Inhella proteolytica]MBH9577029.1 EF-hand domain-containing protein [Inhella proteolytica]
MAQPDAPLPLPHALAWPTLAQARQELLDGFDGNHDGAITRAEIVAVADPSGQHADALNPVVQKLVDLMDTNRDARVVGSELDAALLRLDVNRDGQLSPADLAGLRADAGLAPVLAALMQSRLPGPLPLPPEPPLPPARQAPTVTQVVDALFTRFDGNRDAGITLTELLAVLDPKGHRGKLEAAMQELVTAVDTDHNGSMSLAEMQAAVASLDRNQDGQLDHDDHVPGPPSDEAVDLIGVLLPHLRDFDIGTLGHFG